MEESDKAQDFYSKKRANIEIEKQLEPFAMWSFILSIAPFGSFLFLIIPFINILFMMFLIVAPVLSIIFGIISFGNINSNKKYYGKGFAITGIILSIFEIFLGILFILLLLIAI